MKHLSHSAQETFKLGTNIAKKLKGGEIIGLIGELGSGKTTFVQGLAKELGIKERVISPTFVLIRQYQSPKFSLYHVDLYRIDRPGELKTLGLEEIWYHPQNIVIIEWAEKAKALLPQETIYLMFEYKSKSERIITGMEL
ncbi:tRNA (adenosine(37)-N6)-threonylcarbamoyltransferase complex ATPase subunit type 1 TsaE [Patescibacteria group bacterium]|nr:tRNA (adenosine(37)-N6)-threonylcarbamoyltransferase complex ATPase subunit type 1 TsaE [Patescibacteria group bacterium]MBU1868073.1 tRNA (adenosine(37)-N6)-threonylcarbamoyltransferase complex ATPase subunit type 1 TsaE [Patescibacteria group bacterium]